MAQKHSLRQKTVFKFLLISGITWTCCVSQVNREESRTRPGVSFHTLKSDGHEGEDSRAFYALRSCHKVLTGNNGEFYSPDYLCSNPSLWCNWTIQVDPGKRIVLHLEDLTPDDTCLLKQDQIHVDEPTGHSGGHKVLQQCWQEAKYTSVSNTIHVVVLIGGWPGTPYRGFYGRYQAFGPLVVYNPEESFTDEDRKSLMEPAVTHLPLNQVGFTESIPITDSEYVESVLPQQYTSLPAANSDRMYDYHHSSAMSTKLPWEPPENADTNTVQGKKSHPPVSENLSHITTMPAGPEPTQGTLRSGRDATQAHLRQSESPTQSSSSHQQHNRHNPLHKPSHSKIHNNLDPQAMETLTSTVPQETESQRQLEVEPSAEDSEQTLNGELALDWYPEGSSEAEQIHFHQFGEATI